MNASLQNRRTWVVGGAAVAAVISAASWFFVISPVHSDTDSVQARTVSVQQQNVIAQHKLRDLANSQSQLPQLQAQLVRALEALPMANGLPEFTRQLNHQAAALHLTLNSLNVTGFSAALTDSSSGPAPSTESTTTTTPPANPTPPANTGTSGSGSGPVAIAVNVSATGPSKAQLAFLRAIRLNGPRRALVTVVGLSAPQKTGGTVVVTMTVTLTVFATPQTADQRAQIVKLLKLK